MENMTFKIYTYNKLVFLVFILLGVICNSQKSVSDIFEYKATYNISAYLDSTDAEFVVKERMELLLGKRISLFSSKAMSVEKTIALHGNSGHTSKTAVTEFPFIILKNKEISERIFSQNIAEDKFYYKEDSNDFNWKLFSDNKKIDQYDCNKATVHWRGRNYIAWYSKQIPVQDGPYKFSGLPGLIVQIYDEDEQYHFQLIGFEKLKKPLKFKMKYKDFIEMEKNVLEETYITYLKDPFSFLKNPNIKISSETHQAYRKSFTERLAKRNNPIEKN
jgi:GLPGLI family protein